MVVVVTGVVVVVTHIPSGHECVVVVSVVIVVGHAGRPAIPQQ